MQALAASDCTCKMKYHWTRSQLLVSIIILLQIGSTKEYVDIEVTPSLITTQTDFVVTANHPGPTAEMYKFSFPLSATGPKYEYKTKQAAAMFRYSAAGKYIIMTSLMYNATWLPWTKKAILVFDHETVLRSNCSLEMSVEKRSIGNKVINQLIVGYDVVVKLNKCYGNGKLILFKRNNFTGSIERKALNEFVSYGDINNFSSIFHASICDYIDLSLVFYALNKAVEKHEYVTAVKSVRYCDNTTSTASGDSGSTPLPNNTSSVQEVVKNGLLNPVVAFFFAFLVIIYLMDSVIAYRGYKNLMKPIRNLTSTDDEIMFELHLHVGSGISVKGTQCQIQMRIFGTLDVIGPIDLPASFFEEDGIVSFLVSTNKVVGEIGTIGIFCKEMDLRSDWYLRKVEIFSHSEKPSGIHWGDDDVINEVASFQCQTWFSPVTKTQSVAQIFNKNTERIEKTFFVDYISRCKQLVLEKHIMTSWKCSYGIGSFTKAQRLSFLFTLWFVLIYTSTLIINGGYVRGEIINKGAFRVGIVRITEDTFVSASVTGCLTYLSGVVLCLLVRVVYGKPSSETDGYNRPIHIDTERSISVAPDNLKKAVMKPRHDKTPEITTNVHKENGEPTALKDRTVKQEHVLKKYHNLKNNNDFKDHWSNNKQNCETTNIENVNVGTRVSSPVASEVKVNSVLIDINYFAMDETEAVLSHKNQNGGVSSLTTPRNAHKENGLEGDDYNDVVSRKNKNQNHVNFQNGKHDTVSNGQADHLQTFIQSGENNYTRDAENTNINYDDEGGVVEDFAKLQVFNRETLPTKKLNPFISCLFQFSGRMFWIMHCLLVFICILHTIVISTLWDTEMSYHWISMHMLAFTVSCCVLDTLRVLVYVLLITIKERKRLKRISKQTSFAQYTEILLTSKYAAAESEAFIAKEYPEEEMAFAKGYYRLKGKNKDFIVLAVFVAALLILTTRTMNKNSFDFWVSLQDLLFKYEDLTTIQIKEGSKQPVTNFWDWMKDVLPPILNSSLRDTSMQQLYIMENTLHIVQKRVLGGECKVPHEMQRIISLCSVELNEDNEDKRFYSSGWQNVSSKQSPNDSLHNPWIFQHSDLFGHGTGRLKTSKTFSLSGYVGRFNSSNIAATIENLIEHKWIDKYTRLLYLEALIYNPSINFVSPASIALEFSTSGYIFITRGFFNFILYPELSEGFWIVQFTETLFFVLTFYLIFDLLKRKQRTSVPWFSGWLIVQELVIIQSFAVIAITFFKNNNVYLLTSKSAHHSKRAEAVHALAILQESLEYVLSSLNLFSIALLTKPLFTLGLFDDMYIAVSRTVQDLKGIAMETIVLVVGFTFWAYLSFVDRISSFSTIERSFPTLMEMLVSPDNGDLLQERFYGVLLSLVYYCVMILLVSNIVISAVQRSYSEARQIYKDVNRTAVMAFLFKRIKHKPGKTKEHTKYDLTLQSMASRRTSGRRLRKQKGTSDLRVDSTQNGEEKQKNGEEFRSKDDGQDSDSRKKEETQQCDHLEQAVTNLNEVMNKKIPVENIEDKILISTIIDSWRRVVENKVPINIISTYKRRIRKSNKK